MRPFRLSPCADALRFVIAAARALRTALLVGAALLASASVAPAAAPGQCEIALGSVTPSPVNWTGSGGGYNVLDSSSYYQQVAISVQKTHSGAGCSFMIGATIGTGDSYTNRTLTNSSSSTPLNFNLYVDSSGQNILENPSNAGSANVISGSVSSGGTTTKTYYFYFHIPPSQFVATTSATLTYSRTVTFYLYTGTISRPSEVSQTTATFSAAVPPVMSVSVGAPSFTAPVVLGTVQLNTLNFQSTNTGSTDLYVQSNTGFKLSLTSVNGGYMKYITNLNDPSAVPYTVTLNGSVLSLTQTTIIAGSTAPTGLGGLDLPLVVKVLPQSQWTSKPTQVLSAGSYADVIVITAIAQ